MSELKISPGPWSIKLTEEINVYAGEDWVALTAYESTPAEYWERSLADARLIVASPGLFAAVEALLFQVEGQPVKHPQQTKERANAKALLEFVRNGVPAPPPSQGEEK